jgi:hypothetical protein
MYVRKFLDIRDAVDLILVSVKQVVVANQEKHIVKVSVKLLKTAYTVIKCTNVDCTAIVMPIATKDAVLATPFFSLFYHPVYELLTASIMLAAIIPQTIVYISEVNSL